MSKFVDYSWHRFCLDIELDHYEEHSLRIESLLVDEIKKLHEKIIKESEYLDGYEKAVHFENYGMEFEYIVDVIPCIQRSSELIMAYSLLERNLVKICNKFEKVSDNPVKRRDFTISNGIIDQARKYLEKVVKIKFPVDNEAWKEILHIQQLRNSYVHCNGEIKSGNTPLISYVKNSEYLDITDDYAVEINEGFVRHVLQIFRDFFNVLFEILEEKNTPKLRLHKS